MSLHRIYSTDQYYDARNYSSEYEGRHLACESHLSSCAENLKKRFFWLRIKKKQRKSIGWRENKRGETEERELRVRNERKSDKNQRGER